MKIKNICPKTMLITIIEVLSLSAILIISGYRITSWQYWSILIINTVSLSLYYFLKNEDFKKNKEKMNSVQLSTFLTYNIINLSIKYDINIFICKRDYDSIDLLLRKERITKIITVTGHSFKNCDQIYKFENSVVNAMENIIHEYEKGKLN